MGKRYQAVQFRVGAPGAEKHIDVFQSSSRASHAVVERVEWSHHHAYCP